MGELSDSEMLEVLNAMDEVKENLGISIELPLKGKKRKRDDIDQLALPNVVAGNQALRSNRHTGIGCDGLGQAIDGDEAAPGIAGGVAQLEHAVVAGGDIDGEVLLEKGERAHFVEKVAFGLGERLHHYPNQLSGGEQQRCAI